MSSSEATTPGPGFLARHFPTFTDLLGNLGWPILLRQLRADFRKNRFFLSHLTCLSILGVTLIVMIANKTESQLSAAQVGRDLFNAFFLLMYLIILVIFPAFSATAFAEERSSSTIDLLLTTTLRPTEIVWGKFLASTAYCMVYVIASIPLLSITFLFGGVSLSEVLWAYAILVGMTLFLSMLGVAISSCFGSAVRSTIAMYLCVAAAIAASYLVWKDLPAGDGASTTVIVHLRSRLGLSGGSNAVDALAMTFGPLALFGYLFLIATNRIRPPKDDRTSALRALTFVTVLGLLAVSAWAALPDSLPAVGAGRRLSVGTAESFRGTVRLAAYLLFISALVFSTEDAAVSRRNRSRFRSWSGIAYPLRIFAPGAFWGFVYTVVLAVAACGGLYVFWEMNLAQGADTRLDYIIEQSLRTIPVYASALAALGFLLAVCDFTPLYSRLTLFFLFIIALLLPVIFMLSRVEDKVWTFYYLSPITLWASLEEPIVDDEPKYMLYRVPIIYVAQVLFMGLTVSLATAAAAIARRSGYPLLRFGGVESTNVVRRRTRKKRRKVEAEAE
jgi:hypothetical protein